MVEPVPTAWRETLRRRTAVAAALLGLWMAVIECRLIFLQVIRHGEFVALSKGQQMRGEISVGIEPAVFLHEADAAEVQGRNPASLIR